MLKERADSPINSTQPFKISLLIKGINMDFKVDTESLITALSIKEFRKLGLKLCKLNQSARYLSHIMVRF